MTFVTKTGDEKPMSQATGASPANPARSEERPGRRFHAMDALRSVMMLGVVLAHAMLPYMVTRKSHMVADPSQSPVFDFFLFLGLSLLMQAFFFSAGFLAASSSRRSGLSVFVRKRASRILIPFLVLWLVLAPITTAAVDLAHLMSVEQSIGTAWNRLSEDFSPKWSRIWHLWFLPALLLFYLVWLLASVSLVGLKRLVPLDRYAPQWPALDGLSFSVVFGLPLVPVFFVIGTDVESPLNFAVCFWFFCCGLYLFSRQSLLAELERSSWINLCLGLSLMTAAWVALWPLLESGQAASPGISLILGVLRALSSGFLVFGVVGLFFRYSRNGNKTIGYIAGASYWIYVMHFPLVRMGSGLLSLTELPASIKILINVSAVLGLLLVVWEVFLRRTFVGAMLGERVARSGQMERPIR